MKDFYWYLICVLSRVFCALPHKTAVRLGDLLGRVMWLVSKRRVDKAEQRCVRALGVGVTLARKIVLGSYRNIGRGVAETLRLPKVAPYTQGGGCVVADDGLQLQRKGLQRSCEVHSDG